MELGVGIDAYSYRGQDVRRAAAADVAYITYIKSLHANAVWISFPFFLSGPGSSTVYATTATPSPAQLAVIARTAVHAGLYVSIRPLLAEGTLGTARSKWRPRNMAIWFASYTRFLLPYAYYAQRVGVRALIVDTEFTDFSKSPYWNRLDQTVRRYFHGTLAFASNWSRVANFAGNGSQHVQEAVDAYPADQRFPERGLDSLRPGTARGNGRE
jgi:hypothetical protein